MYENIYGLSCVENHILAVLKDRGMDISPLYHNCAMPLKEIFYYMVMLGREQEYFDQVPRIQETLKKLEIISFVLKSQANIQSVRRAIRSCKDNQYILLKVTPEFTRNTLHARGLRDDHFVLVKAAGGSFAVQNDIPDKTIILTANQLTKAYGGDYFKLSVKRELNKNDREYLWESRIYKPDNFIPFYFYEKDFNGITNLGVKLRNMAGIYKTLRQRLAAYYSDYVDTGFIFDALSSLEKYHTLLEYYNLKKGTTIDKYMTLLCELNKIEINIMMELRDRLDQSLNYNSWIYNRYNRMK